MSNEFLTIPRYWLDWLAVFGYVVFLVFIAWRVLMTKTEK